MQTLYHVSYILKILMSQNLKHLVINNSENKKITLFIMSLNKKKLSRNKIVITNSFLWRYGVSIQSLYLSHAKQVIYHLSYIPTILISENPKCPIINSSENEKNISANYVINKERLNRSKILITNSFFWKDVIEIKY